MSTLDLAREIAVEGRFRIRVPSSTTYIYDDEDGSIALQISPGTHPLYLLCYPLQSPYSRGSSILKSESQRFLAEGILPACGSIVGSSVEQGSVNGTYYSQVVAKVTERHWWIARLVSKPDLSEFYLLHCNGDESYLTLAVCVFSEFYLL